MFLFSVSSDDHVVCYDVNIRDMTKQLLISPLKYLAGRGNTEGHPEEGISGEWSVERLEVTACICDGICQYESF